MSMPSPEEFYEDYKNNPNDAGKAAREIGLEIGRRLSKKVNAKRGSLEGVAAVLNEFQKEVEGDPNAEIQGRKVFMRCTGFCPLMRTALSFNVPWEWLDVNFAWPMIEGIASYLLPGIKLSLPYAKSRGDPECLYIFEAE